MGSEGIILARLNRSALYKGAYIRFSCLEMAFYYNTPIAEIRGWNLKICVKDQSVAGVGSDIFITKGFSRK